MILGLRPLTDWLRPVVAENPNDRFGRVPDIRQLPDSMLDSALCRANTSRRAPLNKKSSQPKGSRFNPETGIFAKAGDSISEEDKAIRQRRTYVGKPFATPEELAAVVALLASDRASFVTGQCYDASGGRAMMEDAKAAAGLGVVSHSMTV